MAEGRRSSVHRLALRTDTPVDDLGLVDIELPIIDRRQARRVADRTVDIDKAFAAPADEVMVIVTDSSLVPGRRSSRLDETNDSMLSERSEDVVDSLARDCPYVLPDTLGDKVCRCVGMSRQRSKHGQSLGRDVEPMPTQRCRWVVCGALDRFTSHGLSVAQGLDRVKKRCAAVTDRRGVDGALLVGRRVAPIDA